jgi:hypothetical protein
MESRRRVSRVRSPAFVWWADTHRPDGLIIWYSLRSWVRPYGLIHWSGGRGHLAPTACIPIYPQTACDFIRAEVQMIILFYYYFTADIVKGTDRDSLGRVLSNVRISQEIS